MDLATVLAELKFELERIEESTQLLERLDARTLSKVDFRPALSVSGSDGFRSNNATAQQCGRRMRRPPQRVGHTPEAARPT